MLPDVTSRRATATDATATATAVSASLPESIANRYDILQFIGGGGMGRVYVAYDHNLKRNVAIKVLAPALALNPAFSRQLLREARAAAQLEHAHIAAVHDVVDSDGAMCIVMEMLRGETLASRLRRRLLTIQQLVRYGRQIASALRHAHARGIVHCDLTPANIFITDDDEVKVLDFGLARVTAGGANEVAEEVGASAALIARRPGTPGYMSPEQQQGLALDRRTDVYSFGVVLREMARCLETPAPRPWPSPSLPNPMPALLTIVERATAPESGARFSSVGEIDAALAAIPTEIPKTEAHGARRYLPLAALLAAVVVLLFGLRGRDVSAGADASLAVVGVPPFATASDDRSMTYLASGLTEMLATELAASNALTTARSPVQVASEKDAAALAGELGAGALVLGRVERKGSGLVTTLRVYRAGAGFGDEVSFTRAGEDLAGMRRALAGAARAELTAAGMRVREESRQAVSTEKLLPQSMVRFEEFAQARWYLERPDVATNVDYAMSILNRIVKEEPSFAMAHAALGEAAWQKWLATRTRSWADEAQRHALEALRLSPQQPEIRYSLALIYQGTGRSKEALAELEEVARVRPFNDEVPRLMGRIYADTGRVDEGIVLLKRAIDLRPGYWSNYAMLGNVAFRAGRYDEAIAAFKRFTELRPDSASAHQRLGTAYHASGDVAAALASYQRALAIAPNANAYSNVGTIHYDERRYALAVDAYRRAVGLDPRNYSLHRNLADALRRAGQTRAAREAYTRAIELAGAVLDVEPDNAAAMNVRAIGLARIGRLADAEAASRAALARQPKSSTVLFDRGVILLLLGRKADAVEALKAALAAGYSVQRFASDPDLAALSDQPGFRDLVKRQP